MKILFFPILLMYQCQAISQVFTVEFLSNKGDKYQTEKISNETKKITVNELSDKTVIKVMIDKIPEDSKIIIYDHLNQILGTFDKNKEIEISNKADYISNKSIKIDIQNNAGKATRFATVLIQSLPKSRFEIRAANVLFSRKNLPCEPCTYNNNSTIYDFATNTINFKNIYNKGIFKLSKGKPVVGKPYTFSIINFNPFRDSIILSSTITNFNTDVPELFSKAFSSFKLEKNLNEEMRLEILSDVFSLGQQIKSIISFLKDLPECNSICDTIKKVTDETDTYFKNKYEFDKNKESLISFITRNLDGIEPLYRDSATIVLNQYRNFYNSRNYFNYQIPMVQNVDEYIFNLSILPKKGAILHTIVDNQPISVNTVCGFKMDFSSGLFLTKLVDQKYLLKPDSTVIYKTNGQDSLILNRRNQIVSQTSKNNFDFGVAALMHAYPRITPHVNLSLTLGAGLSIGPNPSIRYLGGFSLLLGKSGRFVLSSGWAAGFVDELANGYQNDQFIALKDVKSITKKTFQTNSFYSLTFNIPLFKSKVNVDISDDSVAEPEEESSTKEETKS